MGELGSTTSAWAPASSAWATTDGVSAGLWLRHTVSVDADALDGALAGGDVVLLAGMAGVRQQRHLAALRQGDAHKIDALGIELQRHEAHAGGVAAGAGERLGDAGHDGIAAVGEDDRHRGLGAHHGQGGAALRHDQADTFLLQLGNRLRHGLGPARDMALDHPHGFAGRRVGLQAGLEGLEERRDGFPRFG